MMEENDKKFMIPVMGNRQRHVLTYLVAIWLLSLALFLFYWFRSDHVVTWFKFIVNTLLLLWINLLPGYFFYFVFRMKQVNPEIAIPESWRVAMITTRAPSEPFSIVKITLQAMKKQKFQHDTWLADENPDDQIKEWCKLNDVYLCSRYGHPDYQQDVWPRRAKCKEGNLAFFYDHYGYENYDIVVQLDADHVPQENYLEEMIRPFADQQVGYVSAPSICDSNAQKSWAARGRLYAEALMHGPLQVGYSNGYATLCIGSHYAVRTKALREIGGIGPELAEDHSTTLMMNGNGWQGVHAFNAIASGEGPPTITACITQEFQWSRSLMILLLTELPKYWKKLSPKLRLQFLFAQLWYPLFGLMFMLGTILPVIAVFTGKVWVSVVFFDFLRYSIPTAISIMAVVWYLKQNLWLRPVNAPIMSWEIILFQILRWPWAFYGSLMGLVTVIRKKSPGFKVTPKGESENTSLSWSVLSPYIVLTIISAIPGILIQHDDSAAGYHFFLIINVFTYIALIFSIIILNHYENKR
jgi:cellulose synthase/poly-beta-1,6-N-acetylglucosamine synthase-like glycosyltransferase